MTMMKPRLIILMTSILSLLAACSFDSGAGSITQQQLLKRLSEGEKTLILDVRTGGEYAQGYIPGAMHIDHREIESRIHEIKTYKDKTVVVYCLTGMRASMVEANLIEAGFSKVFHLQGDWSGWQAAGLPFTEPKEKSAQL
ncbi:rhodanese-like domain-containing protein [Mariprofundus sp. KV]|nr:rhodanese-like domain-containing protein [Mariprofundus sp. KV]